MLFNFSHQFLNLRQHLYIIVSSYLQYTVVLKSGSPYIMLCIWRVNFGGSIITTMNDPILSLSYMKIQMLWLATLASLKLENLQAQEIKACKNPRIYKNTRYRISANSFRPLNTFSLLGRKLKFSATIRIFYILQIQKRIVFTESIRVKCGR